jgi:hypothetical protein
MEALLPISRDTMKILKAQKDEEMRQVGIFGIINIIYSNVRRIAETTHDLSYKYPIPLNQGHSAMIPPSQSAEFYMANMDDILNGLQKLFPGCSVLNTTLSRGQDGKFYDISNMDERVRPFINMSQSQKYIVIDWS